MKIRTYLLVIIACFGAAAAAHADADKVFLRVEPRGPMAVLNAVAFSPDGNRLYAAGYEKVVRVWKDDGGTFTPATAYRVPVGPGLDGTINALAVSPDGKWLAAGGLGLMRGRADFRTFGMVFPALGALTPKMLEDEGTIYVFDLKSDDANPKVKTLRGHAGAVLSLAFLPAEKGKPALLVSAAKEPTDRPGQYAAHLRLWDVAAEKSLAETTVAVDPNTVAMPPGLAAWSTGNGPTDAAVGVSWWDRKARVWAAAAGTVEEADDGSNNGAAAPLAPGRFLTASLVKWDGGYDGGGRAWQAAAGQKPRLLTDPQVRLKSNDPTNPFLFPHDLAVFSSGGGAIDSAVVLARRQGQKASDKDDDLLLLLDLTTGQELGRRTLGPMLLNGRRVAAAPNGKYVAVADADREQVLVYSIADLKQPAGNARPQVLRSDGTTFDAVAFRKKGDAPGLFLGEKQGDGRFIFDFAKGSLLPVSDDWKDDSIDAAGWKVDPRNGDKKTRTPGAVVVSGPQVEKTIDLGAGALPTAWAVLPPRKDQPPLLAVGWLDEYRQPWLALYDLATGIQLRQLAGHAAAVRSLAFSGDGRLLASAGDDQTVCVWTMTDLGQVLGKAGALRDVAVTANDKGEVVVAAAPGDSPLKTGTVVEGLVEKNQLRKLADPPAFYTAFFDAKPGADVVLRVRPPGADQAKDVKATVGQGTDERKPLLCLFVTAPVGGPPARRLWIGWTMLGPYEASSRDAETYLGWHFNPDPDKHGAPVDFARAETYRGNYESPGVLRYVVRHADAARGYDDWKNQPLPNPEAWIDGIDPAGPRVGDRPLVRTRAPTLRVELPPTFPADRVSGIRWRLDDGPWQPLDHVRDRAWSADLSQADWGRGPHAVQVRLETDGGRRHIDKEASAFLYLPEAPHIEFDADWLKKNFPGATGDVPEAVTKDATFPLEADVRPASGKEGVRVAVSQGDGKPVELEGADVAVRQKITLQEGVNVLEIRATNKDAPKEYEPEETAVRRVRVNYYKERPAPTIALSVVPAAGAAPVAAGAPVVVSAPKVVVKGHVEGEENLLEVAGPDGQTPPDFKSGAARTFDFEEKIDLKPGSQDVTCTARVKNSPVGRVIASIVYRPPTAAIRGVSPADQTDVFEKQVVLRAELDPPDDPQPFDAEVRVNDRPQPGVTLNAKGDLLTGNITLDRPLNRVAIRLFNQWGASAVRELQLTYRRPPQIVAFLPPAKVARALQDLQAEVVSPNDLKPTEARLNGVAFRNDRLGVDLDPKTGRWTVTLRDVALKEGTNALKLTVANADGDSPPATADVAFDKPPPAKPVVHFDDYRDGALDNNAAPEVALAFTADASDPANPMNPLQRVELREGDNVRWQATLQPSAVTVKHTEKVKLRPATPTTFKLVAVNAEGGESTASVTLQLPRRPAYVVIDRLEAPGPDGKSYTPDRIDEQGAVFNEVADGQLRLRGRVLWNGATSGPDRTAVGLRVYANGFQQIPVTLNAPAAETQESAFDATVLLTRPANNHIEVELAGLPSGDRARNQCVVKTCDAPISGRRLHLLVIGVDVKDGEALKQQALRAVGAAGPAGGPTPAPFFEKVVSYDPLVGGVSVGDMKRRLRSVKKKIDEQPQDPDVPLSDVVVVYFQGREVVGADGLYLLSSEYDQDQSLERSALSGRQIADLFGEARGARVLMLDAQRLAAEPADAARDPFEGGRVGVFHAFWSGAAAPPSDLLTLLQKGWARANTLSDLAQQVAELCPPSLQFTKYLPGELAQLEFGGKRP